MESLVLNLNRLRVETKYLNEIKELLKKEKRELKSKESNINFLTNLTFNKYFKICSMIFLKMDFKFIPPFRLNLFKIP